MSEKEPKTRRPARPVISNDPYLGIDPKFTLKRGRADEPNSGAEHNPVLERDFPWPDLSDPTKKG